MLVKILYSYFRLAGLIALAQKIRSLLIARFPDHPMIASALSLLDAKLALAVQAIGSSNKQPLTQTVRAADKKRDNSFRSLRDHVQAGLLRENDSYRMACEALWPEFEKNGLLLYKEPYDDQSAAMDSLMKDLGKPENQVHLETIHAVEWKDEVERDIQAFLDVSKQRSMVRSADDTVVDEAAFKGLKIPLELLNNVLNSLYAMSEPEGIQEVVNEVNQYIREANTSAKRR